MDAPPTGSLDGFLQCSPKSSNYEVVRSQLENIQIDLFYIFVQVLYQLLLLKPTQPNAHCGDILYSSIDAL
jgi:hypothetical protein